jgi:hypothetical protein
MKAGLIEKFLQNPELKDALLDTKYAILIEASPYDKIWGIGLNEKDAKQNKPWKALMDVRTIISAIYR